MTTDPNNPQVDLAARRAWLILGVMVVVFLIGLSIVSFWGGPFESTSIWQHNAPPTFPN
jgi:ABC-type transport system involved in cytochrome c biogenesis permease subunit